MGDGEVFHTDLRGHLVVQNAIADRSSHAEGDDLERFHETLVAVWSVGVYRSRTGSWSRHRSIFLQAGNSLCLCVSSNLGASDVDQIFAE